MDVTDTSLTGGEDALYLSDPGFQSKLFNLELELVLKYYS